MIVGRMVDLDTGAETLVINVDRPEVRDAILEHAPCSMHNDLVASSCVCRAPSRTARAGAMLPGQTSGNSCFACGGMTVRTGTCETCTQCGTSGGCG